MTGYSTVRTVQWTARKVRAARKAQPYPRVVTQGCWALAVFCRIHLVTRSIKRHETWPSPLRFFCTSYRTALELKRLCFHFSRHVLTKSAYCIRVTLPCRGDTPPQAPSNPPVTITPSPSLQTPNKTYSILHRPSGLIRSLRHNFLSLLIDNYTNYLSALEVSGLGKAEAWGEYLFPRTLSKTPRASCPKQAL